MTRYGTLAATAAATAMLAGCGGGGGVGSDNTETANDRTLTQVLVDDGETVAATHVAADRFDFTNGYGSRDATVTPEKWTEFSLAWDDATSLPTVTLDGLTHKFTDAEEYRAWEWRSQKDHGMAFECWTCPNGTNLLVVSAARKIEPFTDQSKSGVAIIGLPTATFDNAPVRATYTNISGPQTDLGAYVNFRAPDNVKHESYFGNIALVADFTNQTLSGRLFGFDDADGRTWKAFQLVIPETSFTNDGFSGRFDVSGLETASLAYEGSFYGPDAGEVGGVISGTAVGQDGIRYVTTGMFAGTQ